MSPAATSGALPGGADGMVRAGTGGAARPDRVTAGGIDWGLARAGAGEDWLLLHGTGSSHRSWRDLVPAWKARHRLLAPDLPGHGDSRGGDRRSRSLPGMAAALGELLAELDASPAVVVGHSAGAALAVRMALDGQIRPRVIVSLNGALLPFGGSAAHLFAPLARLAASGGLMARLLSWRARQPGAVERLIASTGSHLDEAGVAHYRRLLERPDHVAATFEMMAQWDLDGLVRALPRLATPLELVVGENDRTVAPEQAGRVARLAPRAVVTRLPGLGHLAHEEEPEQVARLVEELAARHRAGADA